MFVFQMAPTPVPRKKLASVGTLPPKELPVIEEALNKAKSEPSEKDRLLVLTGKDVSRLSAEEFAIAMKDRYGEAERAKDYKTMAEIEELLRRYNLSIQAITAYLFTREMERAFSAGAKLGQTPKAAVEGARSTLRQGQSKAEKDADSQVKANRAYLSRLVPKKTQKADN